MSYRKGRREARLPAWFWFCVAVVAIGEIVDIVDAVDDAFTATDPVHVEINALSESEDAAIELASSIDADVRVLLTAYPPSVTINMELDDMAAARELLDRIRRHEYHGLTLRTFAITRED